MKWVSYQTMLGVMIQAPFPLGDLAFHLCSALLKPFSMLPGIFHDPTHFSLIFLYYETLFMIFPMLPGMALLTVLAMFIPHWSNLQLIGSAITFVQVSIILFRVKTTPNSPQSFGLV